jgi:tetratricopeptide (TPR) repeat protein
MPAPVSQDSESLLQHGRACFERRDWNDAFEALSLADRMTPLEAEDLGRLALSAGLSAHDDEMLATQERLYQALLGMGQDLAAARAAFWLGFRLLALGEPARASGWLGRAQRLIEQHADCVEHGYLLLPAAQRHLSAGEFVQALECAVRAQQSGERFREPDLVAFARNLRGRTLLAQGQVDDGLTHLDEAMVAATAGELTPVVTGIV